MPHQTSPLSPPEQDSMPAIAGARLATWASGQRYQGRDDLALWVFDEGTTLSGLMTQSSVVGAPLRYNRPVLQRGRCRALLVNAGNANVLTGNAGRDALETLSEQLARSLDVPKDAIAFASTGVIGEPFEVEPISNAIPHLVDRLSPLGYEQAAAAIMTTDTFAKYGTETCEIDGQTIQINGVTKGSGMIAPNMATMLAFLMTNATLPSEVLDTVLRDTVSRTFHEVTVDGDRSTSDMVLLFATGSDRDSTIGASDDPRLNDFKEALHRLCWRLSDQVVRDGEGAAKYIRIQVRGASSIDQASDAARAIAESPLVKTAIAGGDPNWGRIAMAIGKAKVDVDTERLDIHLCDCPVLVGGQPDMEGLGKAAQRMKEHEITIGVDLGVGPHQAGMRTCDLTEGYIRINAHYRS